MPGGALTIIGQHDKRGIRWYEVIIHDSQTNEAITGWVNSVALYRQELRVE